MVELVKVSGWLINSSGCISSFIFNDITGPWSIEPQVVKKVLKDVLVTLFIWPLEINKRTLIGCICHIRVHVAFEFFFSFSDSMILLLGMAFTLSNKALIYRLVG